jgi:hypothetical protein
MVDRRSMGDALALDANKLAFIHGDKLPVAPGKGPEKTESTDHAVESPAPAPAEPGPTTPRIKRRGRRPRPARSDIVTTPVSVEATYPGDLPPLLVSLTTRLSPATAEALRRASLEQRLKRRRPHTQQEIVEAAVRHWLTTNGFLRAG